MKKKSLIYLISILLICVLVICGLTIHASKADAKAPVESAREQSTSSTYGGINTDSKADVSSTLHPQNMKDALYPTDVQTITGESGQQMVKTYILTSADNPADIPCDDFIRDGWCYTLTDITQNRNSGTDTRAHTETVTINTDSSDLNDILAQLTPTIDYESDDGYCGLITLDLATVKCEAAGYKKSSYTVTATREYPHLSSNDLSLVPKTITDNGRTLELEGVSWETEHFSNVDYQDIPDSYRAIAKYAAAASKSMATGYVTTAEYSGEIIKALADSTIYTAYFFGTEVSPAKPFSVWGGKEGSVPIMPLVICAIIIAALLVGGICFLLRHNVKVYVISDKRRVLVAKVRISANNCSIDLTPLSGRVDRECFGLEIDRFAAKILTGKTVDVIFGSAKLQHKIAYEGSIYRIEADFCNMSIKALY